MNNLAIFLQRFRNGKTTSPPMIAALGKVCCPPLRNSPSSLSSPLMDLNPGSSRIRILAQQLRLYKAPSWSDENEEERSDRIISQVGVPESASPISSELKFSPKRAAVLICLFEGDMGDIRVILTKRASNLSTHSGEVSLPGGKADEADKDDCDTATREAKEEIGLDPSLVNVVTVLEPFLSKHLLRVTPVVGILSDKRAFKPVLNPDEVEAVFDCPLEMFLKDDDNRRSEKREWLGTSYVIHFFDYQVDNKKFVIWGMTAGILIRAASVVFQRQPGFDEHRFNYKLRHDDAEKDPQP